MKGNNWNNFSLLFLLIIMFLEGGYNNLAYAESPRDIFFKKHPELISKYKQFDAFSFGAMELCVDQNFIHTSSILKAIMNKFSQYDDLKGYIGGLIQEEYKRYDEQIKHLAEQKLKYVKEGDALYFYTYDDGSLEEEGIIILNNGEIREKIVTFNQDKSDIEPKRRIKREKRLLQ